MTCRRLSLPAPALDVHRSGPKELQRGSLRLLDAHQKPSGERGLLARRSWVTDEIGIYTRLSYDASERAHGYLSVARYDRCPRTFVGMLDELDVAAFLADLHESRRF